MVFCVNEFKKKKRKNSRQMKHFLNWCNKTMSILQSESSKSNFVFTLSYDASPLSYDVNEKMKPWIS